VSGLSTNCIGFTFVRVQEGFALVLVFYVGFRVEFLQGVKEFLQGVSVLLIVLLELDVLE